MRRIDYSDKIALAANQKIKEREYWLNQLSGDFFKTNFPYDFKVKDIDKTDKETDELGLECPGNLFEKLMKLSQGIDIKLHMILVTGLVALLYKYSDCQDIVTGSSIIKQETEGQFMNKVLVYRNRLQENMNFRELLLQVRDTIVNAAGNQNYPIEFLADRLDLSAGDHEFPLFDVALQLENIHDEQYLEGIDFHILFSFLRTDETITLRVAYQTSLYMKQTIERISSHFLRLLEQILGDVNKTLLAVDLLSGAEKQQLLVEFNNITADYPQSMTIAELFAEQAKRTPDHTALVRQVPGPDSLAPNKSTSSRYMFNRFNEIYLSYRELDEKSDRLALLLKEKGAAFDTVVGIMFEPSIEMIIGIMGTLKAGAAYLPIDVDFPKERVEYMLQDSSARILVTSDSLEKKAKEIKKNPEIIFIDSFDFSVFSSSHLLNFSTSHFSSLAYVIYTSGSAGRPKGVLVEHGNVIANLFAFYNQFEISAKDAVIQLTSFSFDAFVEEVFPILLRGGKVVIPSRSRIPDIHFLSDFIVRHQVNIIDCTPLLLKELNQLNRISCVDIIISGGDILRREYIDHFLNCGQVYNTYGPTETAVCAAYYRCSTEIPANIPIGKPIANYKVYILGRNSRLQPIGVSGELCIGGAGVTRGYLNNPGLTFEKFFYHIPGQRRQKIYRSGDLARWLWDGNIEFLGRIDNQVKVRGFRIELGEIENLLMQHKDVKEVVVSHQMEEKGDQYLCGYVISDKTIDAQELREYLGQKLPDYMVPWFYIQMERFPLTTSGKLDRKALPQPEISSEVEYVTPRNHTEAVLVELWSEVLGEPGKNIGIDTNFFDLGGNSLKAIVLLSKIHEELDVKLQMIDIFKLQTIRGIAESILAAPEDRFISLEPVEKREYYALSSAQQRIYFLQQIAPGSTTYNMPLLLPLGKEIETNRLETALKRLISRHESLRTCFIRVNEEPVQKIHETIPGFRITIYKGDSPHPQVRPLSQFEIINDFIRPFDLTRAPLMRSGIILLPGGHPLWMVDLHHIVSDGTSHMILAEDFLSLYKGEELGLLRLQYKDFSQWQNCLFKRGGMKAQAEYWVELFSGDIPRLELPADFRRPEVFTFAGARYSFRLGREDALRFKTSGIKNDATLYMNVLAVLNTLFYKYTGQADIIIGGVIAGRPHVDLQHIIGIFVNSLPMRNCPGGEKTYESFLAEVVANCINAYEHQDLQFEQLVDKLNLERETSRNPLFDVSLLVQEKEGNKNKKEDRPDIAASTGEHFPSIDLRKTGAKFDMTFFVNELEEDIDVNIEYYTGIFKEETIRRLESHFRQVIRAVNQDPLIKLKDIDIIPEAEKEKILYTFNDTAADFPRGKNISQLFERQVEQTPDHVALSGHIPEPDSQIPDRQEGLNRVHLSYRELNEKADRLAGILNEKGVQADTIVGIMMHRSMELVAGILGILKAGGAFLPIDPDYPPERIQYMLNDSSAGMLITTTDLAGKVRIAGHQLLMLMINCQQQELVLNEYGGYCFPKAAYRLNGQLAYVIYTSGSTGKPKGVLVGHQSFINYVCWARKQYLDKQNYTFPLYTSISFDLTVTSVFLPLISGSRIMVYPEDDKRLPVLQVMEEGESDIIKLTPSHLRILPEDIKKENPRIKTFIVGGEQLEKTVAADLYNRFPGKIEIFNEYGPTEATVGCMIYKFNNKSAGEGAVPIGRPIGNVKIYILDKYLNPVSMNASGEIYIGGEALAGGYLNRPELTPERFINYKSQITNKTAVKTGKTVPGKVSKQHNKKLLPGVQGGGFLEKSPPGRRRQNIYKTGDLARWLSDGNMEFLGRTDQQVKIRGFRIELGEIENQLLSHKNIKEVVVAVKQGANGDRYIVAYIVFRSPFALQASPGLSEFLSARLPAYMIPSYFVQLEKIPLTRHGKVDKKALPEPQAGGRDNYAAPGDVLEEQLVEICCQVLGLGKHNSAAAPLSEAVERPPVGIDDNFFTSGGHSLNATILTSKIHKQLNVKVPLIEVFKRQTMRELAKYIRNAEKDSYIGIEPGEKREYYALSPAQKRLYFLQQLEPRSTSYNEPMILLGGKANELESEIEKDKLERTFRKLIARHESLRTSFVKVDEIPYQKIHREEEVLFAIENVDSVAGDVIKALVKPFDLSEGPLLRVCIINHSRAGRLLFFDMHHIVTDDRSQNILRDEFITFFADPGLQLPALRLQYKDYSQWLNYPIQRQMVKRQEVYWLRLLSGELPVLALPLDYPRPEFKSFEGSSVQFELTAAETGQLQRLSQESGVTLYMALLLIFNILLAKLSGQEDIIMGTPIAARRHTDLQHIIGMFVNTIVMRSYPSGHKSLGAFLKEVKEQTLSAYENQEYPFEDLVEKISGQRDTSRNPVFDVMFAFINDADYPGDIAGPDAGSRAENNVTNEYKRHTSKFDLNLTAVVLGNQIFFDLEYCTRLFKQNTINRIIEYFKIIVSWVGKPGNRNLLLSRIEILPEKEKKQLLFEFNHTRAEFPRAKALHWLVEEQARLQADKIALVFRDRGLTYGELNKKSNSLAFRLKEKGVRPDTLVGLMVERSLEMIVGILAILKAGGAYLPVDAAYPETRKIYMINDSAMKYLLTDYREKSHGNGHTDFIGKDKDIEVIDVTDKQLYLGNSNDPVHINHSSHLTYLIYTSGSTGRPKGVMLEHRNLVNLLIWGFRHTNLDFGSVLQFSTISFDASFHEIFSTLLWGGKLCLIREKTRTDIPELFGTIARQKIKTVFLPMSLLKLIFSQEDYTGIFPACVTHIQTAGEQVVVSDRFRRYLRENHIYLHNHYGPTEAHVVTALTMAPHEEIPIFPPIGKPVSNTTIFILDNCKNLQPIGVPGELYIGGVQVGRGYLNQPELTLEKFILATKSQSHKDVNFSWCPGVLATKLYKTGDLSRWLYDGNIEFLGRLDQQVKIRGFRIELGEIEAQLLKHTDIKEAVVLVSSASTAPGRGDPGEKYLCAYIVQADAGSEKKRAAVDHIELREFLSSTLPDYMIPSYFIPVERIPVTPSGKVDRKALPGPAPGEMFTGESHTAPRDDIERKLVKIWWEVLGKEAVPVSIGIDDNFFALGGHSLIAAVMISKIHRELQVKVPLAEIFRSQTARKLSTYIKDARKSKYAGIEPVEKREYYALSSAQKRIYFLLEIAPGSTTYNMPLMLPLGKDIKKDRLESALKRLIARHENLRTSFEKIKEEPVQRIHDEVDFGIEYYVEETIIHDFVRPFDLSRTPLIRSGLIKLPGGDYTWIVDMHHIISDGTSLTILSEDFLRLYNERELEPLRLHYKDFSQWQNSLFSRGEIKFQEKYWSDLFSDEIPRLELPTDYKRPEVFTFAGKNYAFMPEKDDALAFQALAARNGATLYMNFLALLNTLFYKYTGQTDIIIGTGIAGRPHADLQHIIGMFINTLAMRNAPRPGKTYASFLKEVVDVSIDAFENQDVQFEELVEKLNLERDPSRNPLFDISMVVQNFRGLGEAGESGGSGPGEEHPGRFEVLPAANKTSPAFDYQRHTTKFDMTFFVQEFGGDIFVGVEYYSAVFEEETISRLASHIKQLIKVVTHDPGIKLKDIEILPPGEKVELLYTFNDTGRDFPRGSTLVSLFDQQVKKTPGHIALVYEHEELTYKELAARSGRMASYLYYNKCIRPGSEVPVGIMMSRPIELSIALFGILKAGGAYVPLDPQLPGERIKFMINDAGIDTVISEKKYVKMLNRLQWECRDLHSYLCVDSADIHEEDESEKSELMNRELWHHVGETASDDITGGGWVSSYTGAPFSRREMDEYSDNIFKKLEPFLHDNMRVLEIGCASGLTMFRLAPRVKFYYGTDLSRVIIRENKKRVIQEGHQNIKLAAVPAHEIDQLEEKNFDLLIMNSVVQCFHGHNYLGKVIKKSIDLLAEKGFLFIGDVMDQDRKDMLVREMTEFKYAGANRGKGYTTKTDFSAELFLSGTFWKDLELECSEITAVEFSDKIYTIENELTRFRYDVLITVDKQLLSAGKKKKRKKSQQSLSRSRHQDDTRDLSALSRQQVDRVGRASSALESTDLAYIIYTSGTTGRPKGVKVEHRGVVNTLLYRKSEYEMNPRFICLQLFSYSFDGYVTGFFTPMISGSKVILLEKEELADVARIREMIVKTCVTHFISVPPLYLAVVETLTREELASLQVVTLAGDKISQQALKMTRAKSNTLEIANEYGLTETSVMSTIFRHQELTDVIKIGHPIGSTRIYILDTHNRIQPINVPGELCISGMGLARGYLNNPELTDDRFKIIDFADVKLKRQKIYKTGDLARWLAEGQIEFLGRIDLQVKIRGFRIELGEIETRLLKHDLIDEAVAVDLSTNSMEKFLCAYVVATGPIEVSELKDFLSRTLPEYMIPPYLVQVDKIPLTLSGKINRNALPAPGIITGDDYEAPRTATQRKLQDIWSEVLHIDKTNISIHANFFDLGGHSLKATVLTAKIHKELNVKVLLAEVFRHQTINKLSGYIDNLAENKYAGIIPVEKKEYYPLSSAQKRLYFLQQMDVNSTSYNMPLILPLGKDIEKDKLESTLNKLIARHESLRTSFRQLHEEPVQQICHKSYRKNNQKNYRLRLQIADYQQNTNISKEFIRPFDLSRAPLVRSGLIELPGGHHIWMVDMHHIISDGTSHMILTEDFMTLYTRKQLKPLRLHYKDFSHWQDRLLQSREMKARENYWLKLFSGEIPRLELPADCKRPEVFTFAGERHAFKLEKNDASAFKALGNQNGATLYMNFLAALNTLFYKYTNQTDIIIGGAVAGRPHADLQHIIGMFVNTLAMRNYPNGEKTYPSFLKEVVNNSIEAFQNQDVQFESLVDKLNIERNTARNPLFDITMVVQNFRMPNESAPGQPNRENKPGELLEVLPLSDESLNDIEYKTTTAKFDLTFFVHESKDDILVIIEYYTGIFKEKTIRCLESHFINVIKAITRDHSIILEDIEIISRQEKEEVLYTFNDTARDYPRHKTIHQLFNVQVTKTPDQLALIGMHRMSGETYITYRELDNKSDRLASLLKEKGVQPDTTVILMEGRTPNMISWLLGILKAGGAYLPVDPEYPDKRRNYMLKESNARLIVRGEDEISDLNKNNSHDEFITQPSQHNLAYILYTSGTTGQPKGVMVEHQNVVRLVKNTDYVNFLPNDRILQTGALDFDASTFEIWGPLLNGLVLCLTQKEEIISARQLKENIRKYNITIMWLTSPLFNQMAETDLEIFSGLRHFLVGGDALSPRHINMLIKKFPHLIVTNGYGPTENTTFSTTFPIEKEYDESIPIGKPIANSTVYIVDKHGYAQPKGLAGEIWLGGDGISRGYLNNPDLTAKKYCLRRPGGLFSRKLPPWTPRKSFLLEGVHNRGRYPGGGAGVGRCSVYMTGDRGRWLQDGNIHFLGRIDNQVKIRGFRIETGEIEFYLSKFEEVKDNAVLVKENEDKEKFLCAYVMPDTVNVEKLKEYLNRQVPHYMIPALFVTLKQLPLTPNGKIDRSELSLLGEFDRTPDSTYIAPETRLEKLIADSWKETLNLEKVSLIDNFFDVGGNSINLLKVHTKLEKTLKKDIPIVKLFEYPTIRSLAVFLGQEHEKEEDQDTLLLHQREQTGKTRETAVIGMAGIFPGAGNVREFWENLKNGKESIAFFSDEELKKIGATQEILDSPNYVKAKGVIEKIEYFDAAFFDYTPREATVMDPQVRLFHQLAWQALEDAGYYPFSYAWRIGLYAGSSSNIYWEAMTLFSSAGRFSGGIQGALLRNRDFMCTRISYKLNLKGPSFSVQTACSTSLVAIHLACQGILNNECEMALAGGVTISTPQTVGYFYQEGMIESPDGHCRAFDANSRGLVGGNGAGVVVLKNYREAITDRDHIYAIIKGSAINNDGFRKIGYTAPSVDGQAEIIRTAQHNANVEPESITYIETHGTGTELGDPVEIEALKKAFNTNKKRYCGIGSIKTNIGHLDAAAGAAGFIKTVLALKHHLIPPNLHFISPNPKLRIEESPFYVIQKLTQWKANKYPRRAGVSSLGIGGTNAHIILEENPDKPYPDTESIGKDEPSDRKNRALTLTRDYQLILLSARTRSALEKQTENFIDYFKENPAVNLADATYTLHLGRKPCQYRKMLVCPTVNDAIKILSSKTARKPGSAKTVYCKEDNPPVIFIFPGQGSQYVNMGLELYETEPVFREETDRCFEIARGRYGYDLKEILYPSLSPSPVFPPGKNQPANNSTRLPGDVDKFNQTEVIQLLMFIFEYALAAMLMKWGIRPAAAIGYSLGEYAAACTAGVFSLEDALELVAERGKLIQSTPRGAMLSVPLNENQLKPLLNKHISLAIVNGPSCIVAGSTEAVDDFEKEMKEKRLICTRVNISHAVHSYLMLPIQSRYENIVKEVKLNKPRIPYISNVSGDWITGQEAVSPRYWAKQMCAAVRFSNGIDQLIKEENAVFIEVGPGRVLGNIIRQHPHKKPGQTVVNPVRHQQENISDNYLLTQAVGQLWLYGVNIDWTGFYSGQKRYRLSLPTYPFEGKRYWIDETLFKGVAGMQPPDGVEELVPGKDEVVPGATAESPEIVPNESEEEYQAPRSELEQNIAAVWQEFLGFEKIGVFDNFFYLNGDSLTASQLITRIKEIYPVEVTLQDFFEEPTIAHLAQIIKKLLIERIKNLSPEEKNTLKKQ